MRCRVIREAKIGWPAETREYTYQTGRHAGLAAEQARASCRTSSVRRNEDVVYLHFPPSPSRRLIQRRRSPRRPSSGKKDRLCGSRSTAVSVATQIRPSLSSNALTSIARMLIPRGPCATLYLARRSGRCPATRRRRRRRRRGGARAHSRRRACPFLGARHGRGGLANIRLVPQNAPYGATSVATPQAPGKKPTRLVVRVKLPSMRWSRRAGSGLHCSRIEMTWSELCCRARGRAYQHRVVWLEPWERLAIIFVIQMECRILFNLGCVGPCNARMKARMTCRRQICEGWILVMRSAIGIRIWPARYR